MRKENTMLNPTNAGQASLHDSPVQDAVAKIAMDPKLSNSMIADKVRKVVVGSLASAKSVATQVRLLRQKACQFLHGHANHRLIELTVEVLIARQ